MSPVEAVGIGVIFAGLLVFYVPSRRSQPDSPTSPLPIVMVFIVARSLGGLTQRAIVALAAAGVALALGQIAFFTAANEGNIGVVAVLGSLTPIVVALLALGVLKEQMTRMERVALVILLVGTCLVVG